MKGTKRKHGKAALIVLLVAIISLLMLSGCGNGDNAITPPTDTNDAAAAVEEAIHFTITADTATRIGSFSPETRARLDILLNTVTVDPPLGSGAGYFTVVIETTMDSEFRPGEDIVVEIQVGSNVNDVQTLAAEMLRQLNSDTAFTALYSVLIRNEELRIETKFLHDEEELNILFK
jgi:hypothetical protein